MNAGLIGKLVVGAAAVVSGIVGVSFYGYSKRSDSYAEQTVRSKVHKNRTDADKQAEENLKNCEDIIKRMNEREARKMSDAVSQYKDEIGYRDATRNIARSADEKIADYKRSINYNNKKNAAIDEAAKELDNYDNEINYAAEQLKYKNDKLNAESTYKSDMSLIHSFESTASEEQVKASKHQAEEKRDKAIKAAKDRFEAVNAKRNDKRAEIGAKKARVLNSLDEDVAGYSSKVKEDAAKDLEQWTKKVDAKKAEVTMEMRNARTPEEKEALNNHADLKRKLKDVEWDEEKRVHEELDSLSFTDKVGMYLKSLGITPTDVWILGLIPAIPVGYCAAKYFSFLKKLSQAVK